LLYNPVLYFSYLILIFISYFVSSLLDIRIGFINNGSIIELFKYGNDWFYFILAGVVIAFLSYFTSKLVTSNFDFQNKSILPKEIRKIVKALGGEDNIVKIFRNKVYVENPNLIDIIKLDCEIHENEITLCFDDLELLKEYF
jgi:hypothetical protein